MTWNIDPTHTEVAFSVRHMMVTKVKGVFHDFNVDLQVDEEAPERSRVRARITAASLDTNVADRDAHLRSPDFFDVEHFPELLFESTAVRRRSADEIEVTGNLTIRDVTREVTLKGELEGPVTDMLGQRRFGVSLAGEIDREDFGLTWNLAIEAGGVVVGRSVRLLIDAEAVETADVGEAIERTPTGVS